MAKLTEPTFKTNKIGQREDLADLISQVDAKETPFTSMAPKKSKPGNTFFQWQVESLPTPRLGGILDGKDVDPTDDTQVENYTKDGSTQYRHQIGTYIQKFRRVVRVSDLTEDLNTVAGVKSELARNVAKAVQVIKRDMEITFCSGQDHQEDNGTNPYLTRGLDKWLDASIAGSGVYTVPSQFRVPSASRATGSVADLTEAKIQNVMTSIYEQTGQTRQFDALVGTALKRAFTNLVFNTPSSGGDETRTAVRTLNREAKESTYISNIDVFKGDFGGIRLHPSVWLKWANGAPNPYVGYVIPFDMLDVRYGGNVAGVYELTNNGGGEGRRIEAIAALCVHNPLAFGVLDFTA
jgi:hypothetical protein